MAVYSNITFVVTPACMVCQQTSIVQMTDGQWEALKWGGRHVQEVFPDWSNDQRELLITGTHPDCWEAMFEGLEEEDWDDE